MKKEAHSLQGRYLFKLLAVDVPTAAGPEQRLFVEGDDVAYARGGVISELRDPFLQVSLDPDIWRKEALVKPWVWNGC